MLSLAAFWVLLAPGLVPVMRAVVDLVTLPVMVAPRSRSFCSACSRGMELRVPVKTNEWPARVVAERA